MCVVLCDVCMCVVCYVCMCVVCYVCICVYVCIVWYVMCVYVCMCVLCGMLCVYICMSCVYCEVECFRDYPVLDYPHPHLSGQLGNPCPNPKGCG